MITPILLAVLAWPGPAVDYAREDQADPGARCTSCHGAIRQKAGLRLDTAALIRRRGRQRSGDRAGPERREPAHRAGDGRPMRSERMPPESEGAPLSPAEVAALRAWIDQGAQAPPEPTPAGPAPALGLPAAARDRRSHSRQIARWARNPIDAFLAAAHRARGLEAGPADRQGPLAPPRLRST